MKFKYSGIQGSALSGCDRFEFRDGFRVIAYHGERFVGRTKQESSGNREKRDTGGIYSKLLV